MFNLTVPYAIFQFTKTYFCGPLLLYAPKINQNYHTHICCFFFGYSMHQLHTKMPIYTYILSKIVRLQIKHTKQIEFKIKT